MSVNQHAMGHFHSWVYSGSSFFKYSELILPIYMDGRAETKTTVSHPLVQLHSNITAPPSLQQLHVIIPLPKSTTTPLIYCRAVHRSLFSPNKLQLETV